MSALLERWTQAFNGRLIAVVPARLMMNAGARRKLQVGS
jgi:hypothetical protein